MKRAGKLYPILISDENLSQAIDKVNKTHRWGRHHRPHQTVLWVERTKPERIVELRKIIMDGFIPAPVRHRTIYDKSSNKYREIYEPKLWPDQYVHHALIQVIQQPIMRGMDYWCCGSIPGRGTSRGIKGIKKWMKNDRKGTKYCAELDIHHFYQSLQPEVVMEQMGRIIKDTEVLSLISRTLRDGVPIGNYCSQWYANAVLQPLDHMIREELGVKHYVRYIYPETTSPVAFAVGDVVEFIGSTHYTSANAASGKSCKGGKAKITRIYQLGKSKHPYHLVRVGGDGATVWGWVDANMVRPIEENATPEAATGWDEITHYKRDDFKCKCGRYCNGFPAEVKLTTVKIADLIAKQLGKRPPVNSGLRCKQHNANTPGAAANSNHMDGSAIDLGTPSGVTPAEMAAIAEKIMGNTGGIGIYSWGIHIDDRKVKARWNG